MVATLLELIRQTLSVAIRPTNPQTFSVLMSGVMEAEIDFAEQAPILRRKSAADENCHIFESSSMTKKLMQSSIVFLPIVLSTQDI